MKNADKSVSNFYPNIQNKLNTGKQELGVGVWKFLQAILFYPAESEGDSKENDAVIKM